MQSGDRQGCAVQLTSDPQSLLQPALTRLIPSGFEGNHSLSEKQAQVLTVRCNVGIVEVGSSSHSSRTDRRCTTSRRKAIVRNMLVGRRSSLVNV